jgi:hypothetical protein
MKKCVVCGTDTRRDFGRCANGCCSRCHARYCAPGGETSPGHGLNLERAQLIELGELPEPLKRPA